MKRLLLLLFSIAMLHACKEEEIDPNKRVRPVGLKIAVSGSDYKLTWEEYRIICITAPCPDVADTEAEKYEIQIATEELGIFQTFRTVGADEKSITIPAAGRGQQLVARIASIAKGAPPAYSVPVMATMGSLSQSAFYPAFGTSENVSAGDVTPDGRWATYYSYVQEPSGEYSSPLYLAELVSEQVVNSKEIRQVTGLAKFSADAKQIAYISLAENALIIYDIASEKTQNLPLALAPLIQGMDWSPDGKWLAFLTGSDEESRLWKIATSGGTPVPLTPAMPAQELNNIRRTDIDWSPDGQYIAVSQARSVAGKEWRAAISLYSPEGAGELKYFETQPGWIDTNPTFSPDGKKLAFLSTRTSPSDIDSYSLWVRDLTTGKARRVELLPDLIPSNDYMPHWLGNERLLFLGTQRGKRGYFSAFLEP